MSLLDVPSAKLRALLAADRLRPCPHCGGQVLPGAGYEGATQCLSCGRTPGPPRPHAEPEGYRDFLLEERARGRRRLRGVL